MQYGEFLSTRWAKREPPPPRPEDHLRLLTRRRSSASNESRTYWPRCRRPPPQQQYKWVYPEAARVCGLVVCGRRRLGMCNCVVIVCSSAQRSYRVRADSCSLALNWIIILLCRPDDTRVLLGVTDAIQIPHLWTPSTNWTATYTRTKQICLL